MSIVESSPLVVDSVRIQLGHRRVLFFPDEHLGRNTALKYAIADDQMVVWNPKDPLASDDIEEQLERTKIIL